LIAVWLGRSAIQAASTVSWMQSPWFMVGSSLALVGSVLELFHLRTRYLRKRQIVLKNTVAERTRVLQEEIQERIRVEQALNLYKTELEKLVAHRTAELLQANECLEREIAERRQGEEALRQSEDRYRRFFEEDLAGAFIANANGSLLACNPSFARIIGLSTPQAAPGFNLLGLFRSPKAVSQLMATLKTDGKALGWEFELERTNGRPLHILANIIGEFTPDGHLNELKGYVLDTTERKDVEEQLRQSQKMEAIGKLAGGVAHDFNNLLTAIIGCSELLLEAPEDPELTCSMAREIRDAGDRAGALTRHLLAFSRRQVLKPQELDLNEIVVPMEKMLRRIIGEHILLVMAPCPKVLLVKADPTQMEQVLLNLVVNARDAMPKGGTLTIETSAICLDEAYAHTHIDVTPGNYVRLTIHDTGMGIPASIQPHIFDPFFTTKTQDKGTGLGLSTVYGIVRQSNGHITFSTEEGRGTAFHVDLPCATLSQDCLEQNPQPMTSASRCQETILLAEDDEQVRRLACQSLKRSGYRVLEASGGYEAQAISVDEAHTIQLLLTDLVMPGMNGRELAEKLCDERPELKVLFMSGYTDDVLSDMGELNQNVDLIDKPFTPATLLQRVRTALDS